MTGDGSQTAAPVALTVDGLESLLQAIRARGYRTIGPTVRDRAIVYDDIESLEDLPRGWTDEQDGGHYRLVEREDEALFGYAVGPNSWKQYLHPPNLRLWKMERGDGALRVTTEENAAGPTAFIGVRACELRAIAIQDRVLLGDAYSDPHYAARRKGNLIVAVNCAVAGGTCFCVSMNAGPKAMSGFDVSLTELTDEREHVFIAEAGTETGRALLAGIEARPATAAELEAADRVIDATAASMGREMAAGDVHELLLENLEHPRWDDVASRCLTCANCTMVCPTCFCTGVEDTSDLAGEHAERWRHWDSCFTTAFSYVHGGSVRPGAKSRYRQWMTHKLATWIDQFGSSGCVGCGRCITWCPVGIDITEEVRAIRASNAMEVS